MFTPRGFVLGLVAASVLLIAACGSSSKASSTNTTTPSGSNSLTGTHWLLVSTNAAPTVPATTPFTIQFDATTASGAGPCNRYHLPFKVEGSTVTAGPVGATQIACARPLLTAEQHYFAALEKINALQMQDTQLVLTGPDSTRLVYAKADAAAEKLVGKWDIASYATPNAIISPVPGTKPTMDFNADGHVAIATGCNTASTTWKTDGTALTFGPAASTLMACEKPAGLHEQESAIFAALPRVASVELGRNNAVLLSKEGTILFDLVQHK